MLQRATVGILAWLTLCAVVAQPANLAEDAQLQRRITVWLKMEPMREALRAISRQTGVPLRCQDAIANEKVAIFVEDRPAHEILTQLARLFRYAWRPHEQGGYILYVPQSTRTQEEKARQNILAIRRTVLRTLRSIARELAQLTPQQRQEALSMALESGGLEEPPTAEQRLWFQVLWEMDTAPIGAHDPEGNVVATGELSVKPGYAIYHCLATLSDSAIDALLKGATLGFSTKPALGISLLPERALLPDTMRGVWRRLANDPNYRPTAPTPNPEFAGVWLRLTTRLNALEYQLVSVPVSDPDAAAEIAHGVPPIEKAEGIIPLNLLPYLESDPLWRSWQEWASATEQLLKALPEPTKPRSDRPAPELPNYRTEDDSPAPLTTADVLEQLAWATRTPTISDAFRTARVYLFGSERNSPRSLADSLKNSCWLRIDESGYLLARHKHYLGLRRYELPEAWLRPLEQKYDRDGGLTLDDYVQLAGRLTEAHVELFTQGRHSSVAPLTRFEFEPLVSCLPALRFLASLSALQRQQLAAGQWLPARLLTPTQQRLFFRALNDHFPPAQQLFHEPLPQHARDDSDLLGNLIYSAWNFRIEWSNEDLTLPPEPAVRVSPEVQQVRPYIRASEGYVDSIFSSEVDSQTRQIISERLAENPGAQLHGAHLRGRLIRFASPDGVQRMYYFVLVRHEPYRLPEPKPSETSP